MAKITIDTLAGMMNESFQHLEKGLKEEIRGVKEEINKIDNRLSKLENNHERRITILEDDIRVLKTTVGR